MIGGASEVAEEAAGGIGAHLLSKDLVSIIALIIILFMVNYIQM